MTSRMKKKRMSESKILAGYHHVDLHSGWSAATLLGESQIPHMVNINMQDDNISPLIM